MCRLLLSSVSLIEKEKNEDTFLYIVKCLALFYNNRYILMTASGGVVALFRISDWELMCFSDGHMIYAYQDKQDHVIREESGIKIT
ncbi:hypothetical protein K0G02_04230 [Bacteroides pyogenes]|nr:hypothetical protein [Bacteroides pyogenes]